LDQGQVSGRDRIAGERHRIRGSRFADPYREDDRAQAGEDNRGSRDRHRARPPRRLVAFWAFGRPFGTWSPGWSLLMAQ
jgi:hypothetical protein